jgi:hypothetical protein
MTEWQGPFDGMQGLLEGCVYVGVVAGVAAGAAAWLLHRRAAEERELR